MYVFCSNIIDIFVDWNSIRQLFDIFAQGYGEIDFEKLNFCAVLIMISLISLNPVNNKYSKILAHRLSVFYKIIKTC